MVTHMLTLSHFILPRSLLSIHSCIYSETLYMYDESFEQARGRAMNARSNYLDRLNI